MSLSKESIASDINTVRLTLEGLNAFNDDNFSNPDNIWVICQHPIIPLSHYDSTPPVQATASSHQPRRIVPKYYRDEDADVSILFAVSASGMKTPPMFLIRKPFLRAQWFYPLEEEDYFDAEGVHRFTDSDWFPRDAQPMSVRSFNFTKSEISSIFNHIRTTIRSKISSEITILLIVPHNFGSNVYNFNDVAKELDCEITRFPHYLEYYLHPFFRYISTAMVTAMCAEEIKLDRMNFDGRRTIQMKMMLALAGFQAITKVDILQSCSLCGLAGFPLRFHTHTFIETNRIVETYSSENK